MKTPRATVSKTKRASIKSAPRISKPKAISGIKSPSMHDILRKVMKK